MKIAEIINMNIETKIGESIQRNLMDIKLFFIAFAMNIVIFGQKIFFYSIAVDDYMRFYIHDRGFELAALSGRWAQDLLNNYVFIDKLHVLPYFHGIIGVFTFTLAGYLTAKYWNRTNKLEILIITLLISASPMFAHNLHYNTNITAWFTMALGVIGFLMFYRSGIIVKLIGLAFIAIAIGNYQTIVQVIAAMIIFKSILDLMYVDSMEGIKDIFFNGLKSLLFIMLAYAISVGINEIIVHHYNLTGVAKYKSIENIGGISGYIDRVIMMYKPYIYLSYFAHLLPMYKIMGVLSILGIVFTILKNKINLNVKIVSFIFITLLFSVIPMVINLPIIEVEPKDLPLRAHFTVGWVIAGVFLIQMISFKGIIKTFSTVVALSIIVVSVYYINIHFDVISRQTSADISRANQIVNRIRIDKNYLTEPMKFKIVGKKRFPVKGWKGSPQIFYLNRATYNIFKYFTDFKYTKMQDDEYNDMKKYLIKRGDIISSYPGKNSIIVYKNKVILFLNSNEIDKINEEIILSIPLQDK